MNYYKPWLYPLSFLSIFLFVSLSLPAQTNTDHLEISLLTCERGNALYSTFGHRALRIIDNKHQKDLVFDYGNFDFNTPFFAFQFLRGSLDYHLGVTNFRDFFLWFGTRHDATQMNYNLLWLNPLYLLIPFLKKSSLKRRLLKAFILINSLLLLFWLVIPQEFNLVFIPLIGIILLLDLASIRNQSFQLAKKQ